MKNTMLILALVCAGITMSPVRAQTAQPIPAWDHQIVGPTRFVVLSEFANAAVLDRETGLVWERGPTTATFTYYQATSQCLNLAVGGRKGWRLPSIFEFMTLIDPSVPSPGPMLPAGHPFKNVSRQAFFFWTSTRDSGSQYPWGGNTFDGNVLPYYPYSAGMHAWCVRAPSADNLH